MQGVWGNRGRSAKGILAEALVTVLAIGLCWTRVVVGAEQLASPASPSATDVDADVAPIQRRPSEHPIDPALEILRSCQERFRRDVRDYTCTLVRQERLGKHLGPVTYMQAKFRTQPFSVYFRWTQPDAGKEAIYVDGANDNKILTHSTGLAKAITGTIKLDTDSSLARKDTRHSITESGIGHMIDTLVMRWEYERQFDETHVTMGHVKVNARPCHLITTVHPKPDTGKFLYHTVKVYVDKEVMLPVRLEAYGYPREPGLVSGPMVETFTYADLHLNVGLTELDFSHRNTEYNFSRF